MRNRLVASICLSILLPLNAFAGDWPGFRGPTGMGITDEKNLPTEWGGKDEKNVLWKSPLPKSTNPYASPIVSGDRVFVTTTLDQEPRDHRVLCFNKSDGKELWNTQIPIGPWTGGRNNGYPTPVTDGKRVYAVFGTAVVACLDFDGKIAWRKELKKFTFDVAMGSSPILYKETLLLLCDMTGGNSSLIAFDKATGEIKWEQPRPKANFAHSTPVMVTIGDAAQLVVSVSEGIQGLDPSDGHLIWQCDNSGDTSSPVYANGILYADGGRGGDGVAIDPTGTGNITKSHAKWQAKNLSEALGSPVISGDQLYRLLNGGVLRAFKLSTGEKVYSERLQGASSSASPIATPEGNLYFASAGISYIVKAGPKFEIVAKNELGDPNDASPAVSDGKLFIKGQKFLYSIGRK